MTYNKICSLTESEDNCSFFFFFYTDINQCRFNPCLNGGTCVANGDRTIFCECVEGFQGIYCNEFQMFGLEYVVVKYDSKSWTDAQADCVQRGYNLASVIGLAEADLLQTFSLVTLIK